MLNTFSNIVLLAVSALSLTACNGKGKGVDLSEIEKSDSIPAQVKQLIRSVAEDDTASFARLVSYPLARPYPLRDLNSPEELERYYAQMIDDSLKTALTTSKVSDWEEFGWRGWSFKNGEYIWLDENLYDLPYVSGREHQMLDSLVKEEMASLHPSLRDGWLPTGAMRSLDGKMIGRIDSQKTSDGDPLFRLSLYRDGADLSGMPTDIFTGHRLIEGTAQTYIYEFADQTGRNALFEPDVPDGSDPQLEISSAKGSHDTISVQRIYWLDHVNTVKGALKSGISAKK